MAETVGVRVVFVLDRTPLKLSRPMRSPDCPCTACRTSDRPSQEQACHYLTDFDSNLFVRSDAKGTVGLANRLGSASALPDGKEIPGCTSVDDWPNHHFRCRKLPHVVRHDRDGMLTHHKRHVLARLSPQRTKRGLNLARRQSFATQRFRPGTACSAAPINTSLRNSLILTRLRLASR